MSDAPEMPDMRTFITGILRSMEGNAVLSLASGRTEPTETAPNGKPIIDLHFWFHYPSELDKMVDFAERAWRDGQDAYISPLIYGNEPFVSPRTGEIVTRTRDNRPLFARSLSNAQFSQTIYMDSDSCPPEAFRLSPSRHVQTSEDHGHDYWFLSEPIPASVAATLAHKITTAHEAQGSDPSGWSRNKVLRLPTWNNTYDDLTPWPVTYDDATIDPFSNERYDEATVYYHGDIEEVYHDIVVDVPHNVASAELPPVPKLEGLPDAGELIQSIPSSHRRLHDLIFRLPKEGPAGWRSEQRYALLLELKRYGFSDEQAVAVAWHSPSAAKWRSDRRGVDGLWWELQVKVKGELAAESPEAVQAAPETRNSLAPNLLSHEARRRVAARDDLFSQIVNYGLSRVRVANMPYHVINAWTYLSVALSEHVAFPKEPTDLGTNINSITLGSSSTGKDETYSIYGESHGGLIHALGEDDLVLPAQSSRDNYIQRLLMKDGKISYVHENEFDGLLETVKTGASGTQGLISVWTRSYDGEVPALGRVGNSDLGRSGVRAVVVMHMMGTPEGVLDLLEKKNFYTGWLARNIWVFGENIDVTRESLATNVRRGGQSVRRGNHMPQYFASHIHHMISRLYAQIPFDSERIPIEPTDEAIELIDAAKWALHEHVSAESDIVLWRAVLRRMYDIMWKLATLQAASNGRIIIGVRDAEVALYYVEMWMANAMRAAQQVSDSYFARQCDDIEKFIASTPKGEVEIGSVYRFRRNEPKRVVDEYLLSLGFQGRVEEVPVGDKRMFRLKTKEKA
jgi:hypothetical protein